MIAIDGSLGEGGGQILRTSLALSLVTGKAFRMERIRAGRDKPGLQRQHLTAVRAAAEVGHAEVEGAELGSGELNFAPRGVAPGDYRFDVGTAGSVTLVLQTVLPALLVASAPSQLRLEGGTHNIFAPPFDFLAKAFLPLVGRMGPRVEAVLEQHGFYPRGGGAVSVAIHPQPKLRPIKLLERGRVIRRLARAIVSRLPRHIAEREVETARRGLSWPADAVAVEEVESPGPGNVLLVEVDSEHVTEVFSGFGRLGVPAE
jgi:RNA 3'-terminal phosphate cyclase (ATP)